MTNKKTQVILENIIALILLIALFLGVTKLFIYLATQSAEDIKKYDRKIIGKTVSRINFNDGSIPLDLIPQLNMTGGK